jgi:hypothetical protein
MLRRMPGNPDSSVSQHGEAAAAWLADAANRV